MPVLLLHGPQPRASMPLPVLTGPKAHTPLGHSEAGSRKTLFSSLPYTVRFIVQSSRSPSPFFLAPFSVYLGKKTHVLIIDSKDSSFASVILPYIIVSLRMYCYTHLTNVLKRFFYFRTIILPPPRRTMPRSPHRERHQIDHKKERGGAEKADSASFLRAAEMGKVGAWEGAEKLSRFDTWGLLSEIEQEAEKRGGRTGVLRLLRFLRHSLVQVHKYRSHLHFPCASTVHGFFLPVSLSSHLLECPPA